MMLHSKFCAVQRVLLDKTKRILLINIHKRTVTRHLNENVDLRVPAQTQPTSGLHNIQIQQEAGSRMHKEHMLTSTYSTSGYQSAATETHSITSVVILLLSCHQSSMSTAGSSTGPPPPPTTVVAPSSTPSTSGTTAPPPFTPEQLSWLTHRFPGTSGVGHGPDPLTTAASTSGKHCAYLCRLYTAAERG